MHVRNHEMAADCEKRQAKKSAPKVPCPTCGKKGDFKAFVGPAVEQVMWDGYVGPYAVLKESD